MPRRPHAPVASALRATIVEQVDVQFAIAVGVKQRRAGANDLRHEIVAVARSGVMHEIEANALRDVLKPFGSSALFFALRKGGVVTPCNP